MLWFLPGPGADCATVAFWGFACRLMVFKIGEARVMALAERLSRRPLWVPEFSFEWMSPRWPDARFDPSDVLIG